MLPVIVRKFQGEIVVLFPTMPANSTGYLVTSYGWDGHGATDLPMVIASTTPATPEECEVALKWLNALGYTNVRLYKRYNQKMFASFKENQSLIKG